MKQINFVTLNVILSIIVLALFFLNWPLISLLKGVLYLFIPFLIIYPFCCVSYVFLSRKSISRIYSFILGIALYAIFSRIVIFSNLLKFDFIFTCWAIGTFLSTAYISKKAKPLYFKSDIIKPITATFSNPYISVFLFIFINSTFITGRSIFTPPTAFDLSLLHLTIPKFLIGAKGLINPWWLRAVFVPQAHHSIITTSMVLVGKFDGLALIVPKLLNFMYLVLTLIICGNFFKNKKVFNFLPIVLFLSFPVVRWSSTTAYIDILNTLFVISSISLILDYLSERSFWKMFLLVIISAVGFSVKHFFAIYLVVPLLIAFIIFLKENWSIRNVRTLFCDVLISLPVGIIILIIFYYYNYVLSGDPIYPFLSSKDIVNNLFYWDKDSIKSFEYAINHFKISANVNILSPFTAIYQIAFRRDLFNDTGIYTFGYLWSLLMISSTGLSALILAKERKTIIADKAFVLLGLTTWANYILWIFFSPVYRYLLPQAIVLVLWFSYVLNKLKYEKLGFLFIVFIFVGPVAFHSTPVPPFEKEERISFLKDKLLYYDSLVYLNSNRDVKLVYTLYGERLWLYLNKPFLGDWFGHSHYGKVVGRSNEELRYFFSIRRISHIFINEKGIDDLAKIFGTYTNCLESVFKSVNEKTKSEIFKIKKFDKLCYNKDLEILPEVKEYINLSKKVFNEKNYFVLE